MFGGNSKTHMLNKTAVERYSMFDHLSPLDTKKFLFRFNFFRFILYSFAYKTADVNMTLLFDFCF